MNIDNGLEPISKNTLGISSYALTKSKALCILIQNIWNCYEVSNVAELIITDNGLFITGSDILIDGDATASYFYGKL